ncbi:Fis family transcriptional regulator [Scytonema hofmannii PCC 7110]|uniref:Protein PatA n=1 Tax=Scytonema hofmannii PCC 7110 TaxID=128403 RepID=A0A139X251_9CYAN|nr:response regulator [Scytonema hofmannii]KYC38775.1 Fis family transcriptional regulator [Scytonema hofmannii PCC 7110]
MNSSLLYQSVDALLARRNDAPPIRDFDASKQAEMFVTLKQLQFSGQLVLTNAIGREWFVYLHRGFIVYATGGEHPARQWKRYSAVYLPQQSTDLSVLQYELENTTADDFGGCWQYQLLCLWVKQQKITTEQAAKVVWFTIVEVLFDITQAAQVTYELRPKNTLPKRLVLIDAAQAVAEADRLWQAWKAAKVADCSPNQVPAINQISELQQRISSSVYQTLNQLLEQQQTLREMAIEMKQDALTIIRSLLPYIQVGLVELRTVADLPSPGFSSPKQLETPKPLIACLDDNPWVCQEMEKILTAANYQFVGLNDPLRALGVLLALKPDLIFLDLMMPNTNGYEICGKLRKLACFRYTPIIILTGNDGVIDRVRAKIVGSSDFLSKETVDTKQVLGVINKHLKQVQFA